MTQDNLTWTVRAAQETYDWNWDAEEGISYLPLSHVAAQVSYTPQPPPPRPPFPPTLISLSSSSTFHLHDLPLLHLLPPPGD